MKPEAPKAPVAELPTDYQKFIHLSRYARWLDEERRRETWPETVDRYIDYMCRSLAENNGYEVPEALRSKARRYMLELKVLPSMRALMTSGPALQRENLAGYNCSAIAVDHPRAFDEALYILMCGTGVGFSVEDQFVSKLPLVPEDYFYTDTIIRVADSKEGWARAYKELVAMLYAGHIPMFDTTRVRPKGSRLKTFGGRASGPEPLIDLFDFTIATFKGAAGRRLTPIEVHDIMCKIGEIVVVGGVRRSAMISLSDLGDMTMRHAKTGNWWVKSGWRALANNSAVYDGRPSMEQFLREWTSLVESKSGERGIFNRRAAMLQASANGRRDASYPFLVNPCAEILLRPNGGICNLSEVICRSDDTVDDLLDKVEVATLLGTYQSTLTNFKHVRKVWQRNAEEERLLGVSLTGIMDCPAVRSASALAALKKRAVEANREYATAFGIAPSAAITCVKPSGTVSQLVDSASGIHPRHADHYIRTVRGDNRDPMTQFMKELGVPSEPAIGKEDTTTVFSFPIKAPEGSVTRHELGAIEQLELWKTVKEHWCEHNPSITVNVKDDEWLRVGNWVWDNFDSVVGISFLPWDGGSYQQAPYQEVDAGTYAAALTGMPENIDWSVLAEYESEDNTAGSQTLACSGDSSCEMVDLT